MEQSASPGVRLSSEGQTILLTALILSAFLPVLSVQFPPLVDLPAHAVRYYVAYFAPPDARVHDYYEFNPVLVPNLGFDLLMWGLSRVMGFDAALKCAVLIVSCLIAVAVFGLSRAVHGKLTVGAVFAVPLLMSWSYQMGFLNYVMSVCVAIIGLQMYLLLRNHGLMLQILVLLPLSFLAWICHVVGWGAFVLMICGAELVRLSRTRDLGVRHFRISLPTVLIFAGPAVATILWLNAFSSSAGGGMTFLFDRKIVAGLGLFKIYWPVVDIGYYGITAITGLWLCRRFGMSSELGAGAFFLALAFVALPSGVGTTWFFDRRLLMPLGALFFLAIKPGGNKALVGFPVAYAFAMVIAWNLMADRQMNEARSLDVVAPGDRVLSVVLNRCQPRLQRWELPKHAAGARNIVIRHDGFSNATFNLPDSNGFSFIHGRQGDEHYNTVGYIYEPQNCEDKTRLPGKGRTLENLTESLQPQFYDWLWVTNTGGRTPDLASRFELTRETERTALFRLRP